MLLTLARPSPVRPQIQNNVRHVMKLFGRASAADTPAAPNSVAVGLDLPDMFGHFIGGEFVEPLEGKYFDNPSPINGKPFIKAARGSKADIDAAVKAANDAYTKTWRLASVTERSNILLKIAGIVEANLDRLAKAREGRGERVPSCSNTRS